jgi:hypothetical protein
MIKISVKVDIDRATQWLTSLQREQIPFAQAKALTKTAQDAAAELQAQLPIDLDKPTPFTQRAFGVERATKASPTAVVFIKDAQWQYLQYQVKGGTRYPKRKAVVEPVNLTLNQYGNIPRNKLRQLLAKKDVFAGKVDGAPGIYQRVKGGVKLLIAFASQAQYKRRFDFQGIVHRVVKAKFKANFDQALREALRTAR